MLEQLSISLDDLELLGSCNLSVVLALTIKVVPTVWVEAEELATAEFELME